MPLSDTALEKKLDTLLLLAAFIFYISENPRIMFHKRRLQSSLPAISPVLFRSLIFSRAITSMLYVPSDKERRGTFPNETTAIRR